MTRPPAWIAAGVVLLNDFVLRGYLPGWLTGKLSSFGVAFLFPLVLSAVLEWLSWGLARVRGVRHGGSGVALHLTALTIATGWYVGMQISPDFAMFHARLLSTVLPGVGFRPGTPDLTDLLGLVMVPLAWVELRRARRPGAPSVTGRGGSSARGPC